MTTQRTTPTASEKLPGIRIAYIRRALKEITRTDRTGARERAELSDLCVNTLREFGRIQGWTHETLMRMVVEEVGRIREHRIPLDAEGLERYFRVKRHGSEFRITRAIRIAIFGQLAVRTLARN